MIFEALGWWPGGGGGVDGILGSQKLTSKVEIECG